MSIVSICLVCDCSIVATYSSTQLPAFPLVCFFIRFVFVVRSCFFLVNQNRTKGEGWSIANFKPRSNFIAGRPEAALLF